MRRETTGIIERSSNGGMHSQKAYRRIKAMFSGHGYLRPRLYHLVLLDDIEGGDATRFLSALKALCLKLRQAGITTRWRGCLERDQEKGLHFHVFLLVDATADNPCKYINTTHGNFLRTMMDRRVMKFHLSQPKADIHRVGQVRTGKRKNYASPAGDKLADCLEWVSYLVKARSKPDDIRGIYFSSRDSIRTSHTMSPPAISQPEAIHHAKD